MKEIKHETIIPSGSLPVKIAIHNSRTPINIPPHWHRAIEINAMLSWPLSEITVGNKKFCAKTGRIWMAQSMELHSVRMIDFNENRQAVTILYPYDHVRNLFPDINKGYFIFNSIDKFSNTQKDIYHNYIFPRMKTLFEISKSKDNFARLKSDVIAHEILLTLVENFFVVDKNKKGLTTLNAEKEERITTIMNYVSEYYNSEITLEIIADKLHLSRGYTATFIKENFGMTLNEYLSYVRCQHAYEDFKKCGVTQSEIALKNGFSGLRTMNRQLIKFFGMNARQLQQNK